MNQKQDHSLSFEELTGGQGDFDRPAAETQPAPTVVSPQVPPATPPVGYGIGSIPATYAPPTYAPAGQKPAVATNPATHTVAPVVVVPTQASPHVEAHMEPQHEPARHAGHIEQPAHENRWVRLRPIAYGLSGFALFLILFNFQLIAQQIGFFLHPTKPADNLVLQDPNATTASTAIVPPESLIIIPKINVSAPIVYADTAADDVVMKDLENGVVHYVNTANPGENGNAVIFGHSSNDWWEPGNFKFVFALLGKLEVGDQIQINHSSRKYVYQVSEKKVVAPTEVSVLNPTADPTLTLITCTPPGTSWQRLIIMAKQIQPVPGTKQPTQTVAAKEPTKSAPAPKPTQTKKVAVEKAKPLPGNAPSIGQQIGKFFGNIASFFTPAPTQTTPKTTAPSTQPHLPEVS